MRNLPTSAALMLALSLQLGACSSSTDEPDAAVSGNSIVERKVAASSPSSGTRQIVANQAVPASSPPAPAKKRVIGLDGLGDLRIGEPVPKGGSWAERGAQTRETCRTISSPEYPGVYAIVTKGQVRRITVGQRSDVKLVEGIGVGATERDAKKWFAGFREEPHKYEDAPAKYLTAPNAASGTSALRFEIGHDGRVSLIHVGKMPELAYVEGCA